MANKTEIWSKKIPYNRYFDFIKEDADRYSILLECLNSLNLNSAVIPVEGNRHIFIFPPHQKSIRATGGSFPFKGSNPFLFSAHYDRVPGSAGANDNSLAVFQLLSAAIHLKISGFEHWMIVFTDKEELKSGESFEDQGAFSLAKKLISWGLKNVKIFNFDACGTGDAFIFSTTTDSILKDKDNSNIIKIREEIRHLRDLAISAANSLRINKVLFAPTLFSDDLGFLRAGLAAQTITVLPLNEANKYESLLRSRPDFSDLIISGKIKDPSEYNQLPETWRCLNNHLDTPSRLTPQFFEQIVKFIVQLVTGSP